MLTGQAGLDTLSGQGGADTLNGGAAADRLTGGADADIFGFSQAAHIGANQASRDVITDFAPGVDDIDFTSIDASPSAGFQHLAYGGQTSAVQAGKVTWYVSGGITIIQGDTDGKPQTAEFRLELTGQKLLTAADFLL